MTVDTKRVNEVAEELNGTAKSLHDVATEAEMNDTEFCTALDAVVGQCDDCGWWTDADDLDEEDSGMPVCSECRDS